MAGSTASERPAPAGAPHPAVWPVPEAVRFSASRASAPDVRAAYEHPWLVRATHWLSAISLVVLIGSGLQIFTAFPSFGPKIPQQDLLQVPSALRIGGWLAGALMWHFTFLWVFIGGGAAHLGYLPASRRVRMGPFPPRDGPGVWPRGRP